MEENKVKVIIAVILAVAISIGSIAAYKYITGPKEDGLLENADKNAKKVIKSMFKNVADGKDVVVTFQN